MGAGAGAPAVPGGIVILATMHLAHPAHDAGGAVGEFAGQPVAKERRDLERQAQRDVAGMVGAGGGGGFHDRLYLVIGQGGDDRRDADGRRYAGAGEVADHGDAFRGGGGAGFHPAAEPAVERGDGDGDPGQPGPAHAPEDVEIAHQQRTLGGDHHRVAVLPQHLEQPAHDAPLLLDRLVGVGVGADGDGLDLVAGFRQRARQQVGGGGLGEDAGLEVEAGREAQLRMGRAGEAVDAAVLAAAIGVDRAVEGHVRRGVAGDDAAGPVDLDRRAGGRLVVLFPAVVDALARLAVIARCRVQPGRAAAALPGQDLGQAGHVGGIGHEWNIKRTSGDSASPCSSPCSSPLRPPRRPPRDSPEWLQTDRLLLRIARARPGRERPACAGHGQSGRMA